MLETFDTDHNLFAKPGAGDDKLMVVFHKHFILDQEKSDAEGRPIYQDCDFVRIITPGDRDNIIDRPVRPEDRHRFPRQWQQFQNGEAEVGTGTRLEEWPLISRAMVEELRYLGFRTVEHIAEAKDAIVQKVPGLRQLQVRAQAYLEAAKGNAPLTALQGENEKLKSQVDVLTAQVAELASRVNNEGKVPVSTGPKR